jgi:polyferredoxin
MEPTNYSLSGTASQQIPLLKKIGIGLFVFGVLILMQDIIAKTPFIGKSITSVIFFSFLHGTYSKIIAFVLMFIGSLLFTFRKDMNWTSVSVYSKTTTIVQKVGLSLSILGLLPILLSLFKVDLNFGHDAISWYLSIIAIGISVYTYGTYANHTAGIKNNHNTFNSFTARGILGWATGILLTMFYIQLYWYGKSLSSFVALFDPISWILRGKASDQWFVYGTIYTFLIFFLGIKFMVKYRHNRYQFWRTVVVIFSQVVFAYFLPQIMESMNYNSVSIDGEYLGYYNGNPVKTWPLDENAFAPDHLSAYAQKAYQPVGMAYLSWSIIMFLVITPFVTYLVGKRWYCSWFCGCGGLAETAGDSFRQLSDTSVTAWKIERWVIHSVMVFVLLMTAGVLYTYFAGEEFAIVFPSLNKTFIFAVILGISILAIVGMAWAYKKNGKKHSGLLAGIVAFIIFALIFTISYFSGAKEAFVFSSKTLKSTYGFLIGSAFSGVIGVGFYPILGNRVWCRFGCPMAGYMGLFQRFVSKFRITTNGDQCISCGNCTTYCEQGIDVRAYAQKGEDIKRASCVGCGICSAVCPRGVLKLENAPMELSLKEMMKR